MSGSAILGALMAFAPGAHAQAPAPAPASPKTPATDVETPPEPPPAINLTGSPAPSTGPTIDLSTPAPPPPVARQFQQHEGFYVRVAAGLGTLLTTDVDTPGGDLSSSGGLTLNYDLLVGGGPAPGFTIGGGLLGGFRMSGDWEVEAGGNVDGDLATLIIGPFVDGYPEPKQGLHFGGLAGLARVAFDPGDADSALGFGGAFWAGHDVWVAPEWSLGGLLRLDALRATADDDVTVTEVGLTLMFSVVYN